MNSHRICPIPTAAGRDCWNTPHPDSKYGVCSEHWQRLAETWTADLPPQTWRCPRCKLLGIQRHRGDGLGFCATPGCSAATELPAIDAEMSGEMRLVHALLATRESRADVVYYLRWCDRIKIGTSSNLPGRLTSLYFDEVLAVEPGSYPTEAARHREFQEDLIPTFKEWFRPSKNLTTHINRLRQENGEPMAAAARWKTEHESRNL